MYGKKNTDKPKKKTLPYNKNVDKLKKKTLPAIKGEKPKRTLPATKGEKPKRTPKGIPMRLSNRPKAMPSKRAYPNIGKG